MASAVHLNGNDGQPQGEAVEPNSRFMNTYNFTQADLEKPQTFVTGLPDNSNNIYQYPFLGPGDGSDLQTNQFNNQNASYYIGSMVPSPYDSSGYYDVSPDLPTSFTSFGMTQLPSRDPAQINRYSHVKGTDQQHNQPRAQTIVNIENTVYPPGPQPYFDNYAAFGGNTSEVGQQPNGFTTLRTNGGAYYHSAAINSHINDLADGSLPLTETYAPTGTTSPYETNSRGISGGNVYTGADGFADPTRFPDLGSLSTTSPLSAQQQAGATISPRSSIIGGYGCRKRRAIGTGSPTPARRGNEGRSTNPSSLRKAINSGAATSPNPLHDRIGQLRNTMASPPMSPATRADINSLLPPESQAPPLSNAANLQSNNQAQGVAALPTIPPQLLFNSTADAQTHIHLRQSFTVENDDRQHVLTNKHGYVFALRNALLQRGYANPPATTAKLIDTMKPKLDGEGQPRAKPNAFKGSSKLKLEHVAEWHRYHGKSDKQLLVVLTLPGTVQRAEAYAWILVDEALEIHRSGWVFTSAEGDTDLICSKRVKTMIRMIQAFPKIRIDAFSNTLNVHQFAAHPIQYATSKINNIWSNMGRKKDSKTDENGQKTKFVDMGAIFFTHMTKKAARAWKTTHENDPIFAELRPEDYGDDEATGPTKGKQPKKKGRSSKKTKSMKPPPKKADSSDDEKEELEDADVDYDDIGEDSDGGNLNTYGSNASPSNLVKDEEDDDYEITDEIEGYAPFKRLAFKSPYDTYPPLSVTPQKHGHKSTKSSYRFQPAPRSATDYKFVGPDPGGFGTLSKRKAEPSPTKKRRTGRQSARDLDDLE